MKAGDQVRHKNILDSRGKIIRIEGDKAHVLWWEPSGATGDIELERLVTVLPKGNPKVSLSRHEWVVTELKAARSAKVSPPTAREREISRLYSKIEEIQEEIERLKSLEYGW